MAEQVGIGLAAGKGSQGEPDGPVLLDWELMDPPPLAMYFRPELRRALRLRVFADFATGLCAELSRQSQAKGQASAEGRPGWHHGSSRRASSWLAHR